MLELKNISFTRDNKKILDNINTSKTDCEPDKFIAALGIPLVGTTVSKEIIKQFKTYENFRNRLW